MLARVLATLAVAAIAVSSSPAWSQGKDLKWGVSPVGSSGHKALVVLADLLNKEMPEYRIAVLPTPGAVISVKGYSMGQYDAFYGSDLTYHELAEDSGRFKGFKAEMKRPPVQSFWAFTIEGGLGIRASDIGKIKRWSDMTGKRVFTGPLPFDIRVQLERALAALGVKHQYVQVDLSTVGSHLQSGSIDGTIVYTSAESTPVPWLAEASLAVDWATLNPSADEVATLKQKGFPITELKSSVFKRDTHTDKTVLTAIYFGFNMGIDIPEAEVYKMLTIVEKHAGELAKADESFVQVAKDMTGMQRRGIEASAGQVPIHPGLAKYMREKGAWDAKWDGNIAKQ